MEIVEKLEWRVYNCFLLKYFCAGFSDSRFNGNSGVVSAPQNRDRWVVFYRSKFHFIFICSLSSQNWFLSLVNSLSSHKWAIFDFCNIAIYTIFTGPRNTDIWTKILSQWCVIVTQVARINLMIIAKATICRRRNWKKSNPTKINLVLTFIV